MFNDKNLFYFYLEVVEKFRLFDENKTENDREEIYKIFKNSYINSTGFSFDKETFLDKASGWDFYSDTINGRPGFTMVKPGKNNGLKITGVAGNPDAIKTTLKELLEKNQPMWSMVTLPLVRMSKTLGFFTPPSWIIKIMIKFIPPTFFGDNIIKKINANGSITFDYSRFEGGRDVEKYFIGNELFFQDFINNLESRYKIKITDESKETLMKVITGKKSVLNPFMIGDLKDVITELIRVMKSRNIDIDEKDLK
jgi:hypothetical protein